MSESAEPRAKRRQTACNLDELYAMARAIGEAEDLEAGLYQVLQKAIEVTGSSRGLIYVLDEGGQNLTLRVHLGYEPDCVKQIESISVGEGGITALVLRTREPVFIANRHAGHVPVRVMFTDPSFKAIACVPLASGARILGVLLVSSRSTRHFSQKERRSLTSVGQETGIVVERALLLDKVQERSRDLGALNYVTRQLTSTLELQAVLGRTLAIMCRQVGADHGGIALFDEGTDSVVVQSTWGEGSLPLGTSFSLGQGVAGWVVQNQTPFISNDMTRDTSIVGSPAPALGYRSVMGLPLKVKDRPLGAVIASSRVPGIFGTEHLRLLLTYASQASLAIENALLYQRARQEASNLAEALRLLSTAEYRFQTLAQMVPNGLAEYNLTLRFVRVNQAIADLLGYSPAEFVGRGILEFVAPSSRVRAEAESMGRLQGSSSCYELELVHRDGRLIPVLVSGAPLRDADGLITGVLVVATDLSETRKLEAQRSQAERLAAIGHMASAIAHELRNPLSVIVNSSRMLEACLGGSDREPKIRKQLQLLSMAGASIHHITGELLDHATPRTPSLGPCSMVSIINEASAEVVVPSNIHLRVKLLPDLPLVNGDHEMLKQVLRNLLANSIEACPEGGPVDLEVRQVGDYLETTVADSGTGVSPETLQHIFEPFFTTKATGIGLGLSVSKEIVEKHGGRLEVRNRSGRGTAMVVRLPIHRCTE